MSEALIIEENTIRKVEYDDLGGGKKKARPGAVVAKCADRSAARKEARRLQKAAGSDAPTAPIVHALTAIDWKGAKSARKRFDGRAVWHPEHAMLSGATTLGRLDRASFEAGYETPDGAAFGPVGSGEVVHKGRVSVIRHDGAVVSSAGLKVAAPCYSIKETGETLSLDEFRARFEMVEAPKKKEKG